MKLCYPILCAYLLLGTMTGLAQKTQKIFAYTYNRQASRFAPKPVTGYKLKVAQQVFNDLIRARGDFRMPKPKFVMNQGRSFMAWMRPKSKEIGMEEKAYDVCTQLGKDSLNALAALIAHEIIHYYEKHDWSNNFINTAQLETAEEKLRQIDQAVENEAQADILGGTLAISAGYNTYKVFDKFLNAAYEEYGLPHKIEGYPSLQKRLSLSHEIADTLRRFHTVYQTANLFAMIGAYELAYDYYNSMLGVYQSYEVYNNIGVNATTAALDLFEEEKMPYALPIELDLTSRLDLLKTRFPSTEDIEKRVALLVDAESWFRRVIELDDQNAVGFINLGIVYLLQENYDEAAYQVNKAIKISKKRKRVKQLADAKIVLGVLMALQNDTEMAQSLFDEAAAGNPTLADLNRSVLESTYTNQDCMEALSKNGIETIESIFLEDVLDDPSGLEAFYLPESNKEVLCGQQELNYSELFYHQSEYDNQYVLFHRTKPNYVGVTLKNIGLGQSRQDILDAYEQPTKEIALTNGSCLIYQAQKIGFILNADEVLESWFVYEGNY